MTCYYATIKKVLSASITVVVKKAVSPWFLYLIKAGNGSLYTGISKDVERRFKEHCAQSSKTAKALRGKMPLQLEFVAILPNHTEALRAEIWLKKQTREKKLALIQQKISLPYQHNCCSSKIVLKNLTDQ
ncbi:GIY-YIG nuclease family protein [Ningiella sp. W23]|uniref:GIY-YIG nuclease family protein n=1 Tax=Ningiella sp. W23 TaxID=3023715 RepID=UPI003756CBFF